MDIFNKKKLAVAMADLNNANRTLLERDLLGRALGVSHGGQRDLYQIYGYTQTVDFNDLYQYARRAGIANRVAFGIPHSCWRDGFELYTDKKKETRILEDELSVINNKMLNALERADTLNRIGKFSCLFVGVPDLQDPKEPIQRVRGDALKSVYFRPFAYDGIQIYKTDDNTLSPRFGLPELYQLQVMGRGDNEKATVKTTIVAHWTRVVHIAENKLDSDIEGIPALEPIFNNILNIEKVTGGSAEAYFRNARGKTSFEIDPEFSTELINNPEAKKDFDDSAKKFTNNWQDQIIALGSKVATHNTPHASPLDTVKVNLWSITSQTKMPIRILTGESAGMLAESEAKLSYNVIIDDRRELFCSEVLGDVLTILNDTGMITLPENYVIDWPAQEVTTEKEQADIGLTKSQTIKNLVDAVSTPAGDGIEIESAFAECYLEAVEVEEVDIDRTIPEPAGTATGGPADPADETEEEAAIDE